MADKKIAITHDYLLEYGGAELVLAELLRLFPQADLYTAFYKPTKKQRDFWFETKKHRIFTSKLNKLPFIKKYHKLFVPFTMSFFQHLDLSKYDIVISSSANFAKWLNLDKDTKHIAYIHIPPRFLWGYETSLYYKVPRFFKFIFKGLLNKWRKQDREFARKADLLITNSEHIKNKISQVYGKEAIVINPPVSIDSMIKSPDLPKQRFFLTIGRLYNYKKMDVMVKAFTQAYKEKKDYKLVIIGDGPERKYLQQIAGPNIEFKGFVEESEKIDLLKSCKAFVFAAEEDFGIVMVEAIAAGAPVIAYGKGGAVEIVKDGKNGLLFNKQTPESLKSALKKYEKMKFNTDEVQKSASKFAIEEFDKKLLGQLEKFK